jgi:hypothetical protein
MMTQETLSATVCFGFLPVQGCVLGSLSVPSYLFGDRFGTEGSTFKVTVLYVYISPAGSSLLFPGLPSHLIFARGMTTC